MPLQDIPHTSRKLPHVVELLNHQTGVQYSTSASGWIAFGFLFKHLKYVFSKYGETQGVRESVVRFAPPHHHEVHFAAPQTTTSTRRLSLFQPKQRAAALGPSCFCEWRGHVDNTLQQWLANSSSCLLYNAKRISSIRSAPVQPRKQPLLQLHNALTWHVAESCSTHA